MKVLVFALVLVLMVSSGLALECLHCVPAKAGGTCQITKETCPPEKNTCVAAEFHTYAFGHFQMCVTAKDCALMKKDPTIFFIKCCQEDLCNRF